MKLSLIVPAALLLSGCSLLRCPIPDWAAHDVAGQDTNWEFHAEGETFERCFYESVIDGTYSESGRVKYTADDVFKGTKEVADDLRQLGASGSSYFIGPDASGKLKVQISRGNSLTDLVTGTALDAIGWGDGKHAQLIEESLKFLARTSTPSTPTSRSTSDRA
jgi:hypothetical protein